MQQISPNLYLYRDTCNVYVIQSGKTAILIDFGDGGILDELPALGIETVNAILMTHHHRDQGQGLTKAAGISLYVPHTEQDLFHSVEEHWQGREIFNNYDMRQDRFSLLQSVPIAGTLQDYQQYIFGDHTFTVIPTPGHTLGSITLLAEIDGSRVAFTGDLIAAPGKVWSLAATQWTYNGAEGVAAGIPSLLYLKSLDPQCLLPSHGDPMSESTEAIDLLVHRLRELLDYRRENPRMMKFIEQPYEALTPHLLRNRTSMAYWYVLLSKSGKALFIDFGYDFITGVASGSDRSSRRPWLYTIPTLKRQYGVQKVDVILPTHFHDDHVAGVNLLQRVEGAQLWAAENFADILEHPAHYDLPCLWYDPMKVDRVLPLSEPIQWEEYTITLYPLPGHTLHAVAIYFEVDGKRVIAGGDQYAEKDNYNYVYKNRFQIPDYIASADLYRRLQPDLIITGHWEPYWVEAGYFETLKERGEALARLHNELIAPIGLGAEGVAAWIRPYQASGRIGAQITLEVEVKNPFDRTVDARIDFVVPSGWMVEVKTQTIRLGRNETGKLHFMVNGATAVRRARIAVEVTIDGQKFGQQAEALITLTD